MSHNSIQHNIFANHKAQSNTRTFQVKVGGRYADVQLTATSLDDIAEQIATPATGPAVPVLAELLKLFAAYHVGHGQHTEDEDFTILEDDDDMVKLEYSFRVIDPRGGAHSHSVTAECTIMEGL